MPPRSDQRQSSALVSSQIHGWTSGITHMRVGRHVSHRPLSDRKPRDHRCRHLLRPFSSFFSPYPLPLPDFPPLLFLVLFLCLQPLISSLLWFISSLLSLVGALVANGSGLSFNGRKLYKIPDLTSVCMCVTSSENPKTSWYF